MSSSKEQCHANTAKVLTRWQPGRSPGSVIATSTEIIKNFDMYLRMTGDT